MSVPEPKGSRRLSPEAAEIIETYFARVQGAMLVTAAGEAAEAVEELRSHVLEELAHTDGSGRAASRILGELGPPESLAREYGEISEPSTGDETAAEERSPLAGTLLGVPYDLRMPTTRRIASRLWDPLNTRVFVPRVWGLGWDINFGAVAVKLGLVRPDDEDVPFAAVPPGWMAAAFVLPALLGLVAIALLVSSYEAWPALVPSSWGFSGAPARYWPKATNAAMVLAVTVAPLVVVGVAFARRRPALNRAAAGAFATLMSAVSLSVVVQTDVWATGSPAMWPSWIGIPMALALPFVLLTVLARIGRMGEQRRDLVANNKKERV